MSHKKIPAFIKIITNEKQVVCINPLKLASFQLISAAPVRIDAATGARATAQTTKENVTMCERDTLAFFYPDGKSIVYSVGFEISQQEFDYVCETLLEFLYLNRSEYDSKTLEIETKRMAEWNRISKENEAKVA